MWLQLQIFGFRALWSPYYLTFLLLIALAYFLITGPFRHKFGGGEELKPTAKEQTFFYLGIALIYAVKGAPIDVLSHIMMTAHMTQMAIFLIVAPLFIIKGIPVWIWKKIVEWPVIKQILALFTKPAISLLFFNGLFSLYHIPAVFDFSKASQIAHSGTSIILFIAAFLMWFSLMPPLKKYERLAPLPKIGFIFLNGLLITPACVLIIFAGEPLYASYTSAGSWMQALALCVPGDVLTGISTTLSGPEVFSPLSALHDQQFGGIIMKLIQEIMYGIVMGIVFFSWFNKGNMKIDPKVESAGEIQ